MNASPLTFSIEAWEKTTYEQQQAAMLAALDVMLTWALEQDGRFDAIMDVEPWLSLPWSDIRVWAPNSEEAKDVPADAPLVLRLGCGCLGWMLKPLFWLGIAREVPTYRGWGKLTPTAADHLRQAMRARVLRTLTLQVDDCAVWESWDYGDEWVCRPPSHLKTLLEDRLRDLTGVAHPLEPVPSP